VNIAFATLVILLLATPGYIARAAYLTEDFTRDALSESNLTNEIVQAVIYSIPFHFVAVTFLPHVPLPWRIAAPVNFDVLFRLLAGEYGVDGKEFSRITSNLYEYVNQIALYFVFLGVLALACGVLLRNIVWTYRLDVRVPTLFRYRNRWLYLLSGRERLDLVGDYVSVVDALYEQGGKTQLYRGAVTGFNSNAEGELEDIYLEDTVRGVFIPEESGERFEWHDIPGDTFVLKYSEIKNLNISFLPAP
jgi:hypothetical protein